ncbi:hypothetical protein [Dyadobacter frigoris]|uniref:Uncharacterized protein n=1 Tax=Dyadobacter frigoris TaxID=2576211 RepID=A0A4U6CNU8_9BACT|nr:hypothetical protein [Dyadobacter frigoris]TKT85255.1 hypothetical protein FDK13_34245 [Dyadobacter frigoris]
MDSKSNTKVAKYQFTYENEIGLNSRRPHVPSEKKSGVTIGPGRDLKSYERTEKGQENCRKDLINLGLREEVATRLSKGAGLIGKDAKEFAINNQDIQITEDEQAALFNTAIADFEEKTYTTLGITREKFEALPIEKQEIFFDYAYNGVLGKFIEFRTAVLNDHWEKAAQEYTRYSDHKPLGSRNKEFYSRYLKHHDEKIEKTEKRTADIDKKSGHIVNPSQSDVNGNEDADTVTKYSPLNNEFISEELSKDNIEKTALTENDSTDSTNVNSDVADKTEPENDKSLSTKTSYNDVDNHVTNRNETIENSQYEKALTENNLAESDSTKANGTNHTTAGNDFVGSHQETDKYYETAVTRTEMPVQTDNIQAQKTEYEFTENNNTLHTLEKANNTEYEQAVNKSEVTTDVVNSVDTVADRIEVNHEATSDSEKISHSEIDPGKTNIETNEAFGSLPETEPERAITYGEVPSSTENLVVTDLGATSINHGIETANRVENSSVPEIRAESIITYQPTDTSSLSEVSCSDRQDDVLSSHSTTSNTLSSSSDSGGSV